MTYEIRQMRKTDVERVAEIYSQTDAEDAKQIKKTYSQFYGKKNANNSVKDFVILESKTIIGFSGYSKDETGGQDIYWLNWTAVDQKYKNKGVGNKLIAHILNQLQNLNGRKLYVMVSSEQKYKTALKFYFSMNFKKEAKLKDYYQKGKHCIMLAHTLK